MNNKFNKLAVFAAFGAQFLAGCVVPGAYTYDAYGTTTYTTGGTFYATPAYHTEVTYVETMAPRYHYADARHGKHNKPPAEAYRHAAPSKATKAHAKTAPKPTAAPRLPAAPKVKTAQKPATPRRTDPKTHGKTAQRPK